MGDKVHKFEIFFHAYDSAPWMKELDRLVPDGRYIVDGPRGLRHVTIFAAAHEADLVRISVEKFAQHIRQTMNQPVQLFELIGWGYHG